MASSPFTADRLVNSVVGQIILGNPNKNSLKTIMTFTLEVPEKSPYLVSEARKSDRTDGWFLVPPGGGFSTVPSKNYLQLPIKVPPGGSVVGWIGFCLIERNDLKLEEAWSLDATLVAIQVDGQEVRAQFPACTLPRE